MPPPQRKHENFKKEWQDSMHFCEAGNKFQQFLFCRPEGFGGTRMLQRITIQFPSSRGGHVVLVVVILGNLWGTFGLPSVIHVEIPPRLQRGHTPPKIE